jgi:hypothetical protein
MTKWSVTDRVIFDSGRLRKVLVFGLFLALTATGGYFLYQQRPAGLPAGFASGNGRLEAVEVDVATKIAGRLAELGPHEGDMVEVGAGFDVIWRDLLAMTGVGACFFTVVLLRFRKAVTQTQV